MKGENDMKDKHNIIQTILNIFIVVFIVCFFVVRVKTGSFIPLPLTASVLIILVGVSRIIATRKRFQGCDESRNEYKKIVRRSIILAPIITIAFISLIVFIKNKLS